MDTEAPINLLTLPYAVGSLEAGPRQQARLGELTERLNRREFHVAAEGIVPAECVDERDGDPRLFPNAVGGTESIMVADDLTSRRFAGTDGSTASAMRNTAEFMAAGGHAVGDHDGIRAEGDKTDCGGIDKLPAAYEFIAMHADEMRRLTEALGFVVSDESHALVVEHARSRHDFSAPREVLEQLRQVGGDDAVQHLQNDHNASLAVINTGFGTLDRAALAREFGDDYRVFNVDVWSLPEAAKITGVDDADVAAKTVAGVYFNLAIAHLLWSKSMRVLVI